MFRLWLLLGAVVCGASGVSAQEKLPEFGDITDLKSMRKVYVTADSTQARQAILDKLKKRTDIEVTISPDDSEFILECKQIGHITTSSDLFREMATFEMTAYTATKDGRRRIAWSKTKTSVRYAPTLLTGNFLDAFKKVRGVKK
jgi:hypothetical protein